MNNDNSDPFPSILSPKKDLSSDSITIPIGNYCWELQFNIAPHITNEGQFCVSVSAVQQRRYSYCDEQILFIQCENRETREVHQEVFPLNKDGDRHVYPIAQVMEGKDWLVDEAETNFIQQYTLRAWIVLKPSYYVGNTFELGGDLTDKERAHDIVLVVGENRFYLQKMMKRTEKFSIILFCLESALHSTTFTVARSFRQRRASTDNYVKLECFILSSGKNEQYLARWSRYFDRMFHGNFEEGEKAEIELNEINAEHFHALLRYINPCGSGIIENQSLNHARNFVVLADRFDMPAVTLRCEELLVQEVKKQQELSIDLLELAAKYNLHNLEVACLESLHISASLAPTFFQRFRARIKKLPARIIINMI